MAGVFNGLTARVERLLQSRLGRELEEELEADRLALRQELVDEKLRLFADSADALRTAVEEEAKTRSAAEKLARQHRKALESHQLAETRVRSIRFGREAQVDRINRQLRDTASPSIDAFVDELRELEKATMETTPDVAAYGGFDHHGQRAQVSNRPSILERLAAIRDLRPRVERLRLEALDEAQLAAAFEGIRAEIPQLRPPEDFIPTGASPEPSPEELEQQRAKILRDRYHAEERGQRRWGIHGPSDSVPSQE